MQRRETVSRHKAFAYRNICFFCKCKKLFFRTANLYSATCIDNGTFCTVNKFSCHFKLFFIRLRKRNRALDVLVSGDEHIYIRRIFERLKLRNGGSNVFRNVDKDRSRTTASCNRKRFADSLCQILYVHYNKIMLCNRHCNAGNVYFLKRILTQKAFSNIAGNCDKRNGVHIGSSNSSNKICCARTACCHTNANFSCCTRIAVGSVACSLLVSSQNMTDAIFIFIKLVINVKDCSSRIPENGINTLLNQTLYYNLRTGNLHSYSLIKINN